MYDVAIIGAGPSGSTAARYLAKIGLHVCLVDKAAFPRDKPCGGALPHNLFDKFEYLKSRKDKFLKCVGSMGFLHSPDRRIVFKGEIPLLMTLRREFDNILLETAVEVGADKILGTRVKNLQFTNDKVIIDTNQKSSITARVIIGADGVNSIVARRTGLNKKWSPGSLVVCRVAEIPITSSEIIQYYGADHEYHFYSGSWDQLGYAWGFPKRNTVNVGLGVIDKAAQNLPRKFLGFVKLLQKEKVLKKHIDLLPTKGALVPVSGPIKSTVHDRCLLIGDAAGMVNPLTGGGIEYAMQTGKIAAETLMHAFEKERFDASFLKRYERIWKRQLGQEFQIQLLSRKLLTSPFVPALFKIGSHDKEIQNMVTTAMGESMNESLNVPKLIARAAYAILREAFSNFNWK